MTHDPNVLTAVLEAMWDQYERNGVIDRQVAEAGLDALTAADLSIVGEGQARIGGKVVRLEAVMASFDATVPWQAQPHKGGYIVWANEQDQTGQPLYVAIPTDEGDEG